MIKSVWTLHVQTLKRNLIFGSRAQTDDRIQAGGSGLPSAQLETEQTKTARELGINSLQGMSQKRGRTVWMCSDFH